MHGRRQQFYILAGLIPKALPTTGQGSWRISRLQTTQPTTFQRIFYSAPCLVSRSEPSNPGAKMLSSAISYSTVLCNRKGWAAPSEDCQAKRQKMPKVQNRGVGSVAYRSDYNFPLTGSSFVALSCLFSLTLYSFSILLNVSSDKRERDFKVPARVGTTRSPPSH